MRTKKEMRYYLRQPSTLGRLCLVLIFSAVLFGGSLVLSRALHDSGVHAVAKSVAILVVAFIPFLVLVLGPSDEKLAKRLDYITTNLPATEAAWRKHKAQVAAERVRQKEEEEQQEEYEAVERRERRREEARQSPQIIVVSPAKSVGISLILNHPFRAAWHALLDRGRRANHDGGLTLRRLLHMRVWTADNLSSLHHLGRSRSEFLQSETLARPAPVLRAANGRRGHREALAAEAHAQASSRAPLPRQGMDMGLLRPAVSHLRELGFK
jgi:hypothetical protein